MHQPPIQFFRINYNIYRERITQTGLKSKRRFMIRVQNSFSPKPHQEHVRTVNTKKRAAVHQAAPLTQRLKFLPEKTLTTDYK